MRNFNLRILGVFMLILSIIGVMTKDAGADRSHIPDDLLLKSNKKDAGTGKGLGITKKGYIKAYNQQISRRLGLRFEKANESDTYKLSDSSAALTLLPNGSENIEQIIIYVTNLKNRKFENQHIAIMNLGAAIAIKPDSTNDTIVKTIDIFSRKFMDKFNEGLSVFSFEMSNKKFTVGTQEGGATIMLGIEPL